MVNVMHMKTLRAMRDLSLTDLERETGIHYTWLSRIETGKANPTDEQLTAIKAALGWPSDEAMAEAFALLAGEAEPAMAERCNSDNGEG